MVLYCLLDEINGPTASLENAQDFLFQKNLLKNSMSCPGCKASMSLVPCSSSKFPDGLIWPCSPCKKYRNIRTDSTLFGQKKNHLIPQLLPRLVKFLQHFLLPRSRLHLLPPLLKIYTSSPSC